MMNRKQKKELLRIILSAMLLIIMAAFVPSGLLRYFIFAAAYLIAGFDTLKRAAKGIINLRPFDECFLMAIATVGAAALGDLTESVSVMLFYRIGELFESIAVGKSRRSIAALMDIRPDIAKLSDSSGVIRAVDPDEVPVGSVILVAPGEKIPIDGTVIEGSSLIDSSALTGESVPENVGIGSEVVSGCVNMTGMIKLRTTKPFGESTASKMLELVENASSRKARSEEFIAKFARIYTPAVCLAAALLALLPPLSALLASREPMWGTWFYRALTFLVISCPCALVISIPLTFFAGIGGAGSSGILIKGANFMEVLSKVRYAALDKTGTLTKGIFEVSGIHHGTIGETELLEYAALAEGYSSHPIARSIIRAYGKQPDMSRVSDAEEISGSGVTAKVDGRTVAVGNHRLMENLGIEYAECHGAGTVVHTAIDGVYCGHIVISDVIKPESAEAITLLRKCGVKRIVMLTGDNGTNAESVGAKLGIDRVFSRLLPGDKVSIIEKLLAEKSRGEMLAFVGDGINDAAVLARADVGIAMGALGSDAAIEAADVVLMDDDPRKIGKAIRIASKCLRIVYENIGFAIGVKLICLAAGALGIANMWTAIFADTGVMVIAVLNALRALNVKKL